MTPGHRVEGPQLFTFSPALGPDSWWGCQEAPPQGYAIGDLQGEHVATQSCCGLVRQAQTREAPHPAQLGGTNGFCRLRATHLGKYHKAHIHDKQR